MNQNEHNDQLSTTFLVLAGVWVAFWSLAFIVAITALVWQFIKLFI